MNKRASQIVIYSVSVIFTICAIYPIIYTC